MSNEEKILELLQGMDTRLGRLEITVEGLDTKFDGLETRFDGLETRFDGLETRFEGLETRFDGLETRFDGLETRFDGLETRFDGLETRFDGLEAKVDHLEAKVDRQKAEIMHEVGALIEADVIPKFNLLADGIQLIREQMVTKEDLEERQEDIQTQLDVLKAAVRRNSVEIEKLKKAQ